jgi:hypothetical protein
MSAHSGVLATPEDALVGELRLIAETGRFQRSFTVSDNHVIFDLLTRAANTISNLQSQVRMDERDRRRLWDLESQWGQAKYHLRELRYMTAAREALAALEMDWQGNAIEVREPDGPRP